MKDWDKGVSSLAAPSVIKPYFYKLALGLLSTPLPALLQGLQEGMSLPREPSAFRIRRAFLPFLPLSQVAVFLCPRRRN